MGSSPQLIRSGLWQWVQSPGLERFQLLTAPDQWILRGTILTLIEHGPAEAHYEIVCDSAWQTTS
ncbi:MAG TPA: putative glycolipid-binding domain-containing protein, partial [Terriglobales bacterium]